MPRRARMYVAGLPYHIVQRGNNREACFIEPENYQYYLALWKECADRFGVAVHAFCLMTNHIHFLATPTKEAALSNTSRVVGSRYAQYINKAYHRKCKNSSVPFPRSRFLFYVHSIIPKPTKRLGELTWLCEDFLSLLAFAQ